MATEAAAPTNGVYNGYHGQEAAAPSHTTSASQSTAGSTTANKPDPLEIGWYFVEQYYTTLSKNPDRIHLFYSKKSQLITGVEAEKVLPCVGQKAISEKIKDLEFQDCKVRVLNVDSQASFQNIVVQVIGEMSNKSQPHHKFVQTFVLAEQPNGYFVLNDIFRYLNDDEEDTVAEEPVATTTSEEPELDTREAIEPKKSEVSLAEEGGTEELNAKLEEVVDEEDKVEPTVATNGIDAEEEPSEPLEIAAETADTPAAQETLVPENPPEPVHTPALSTSKPATPGTPAEVAPVKKTWASMVGSKAAAAAAAAAAQPTASQTAPSKPTPSATGTTTASGETSTSNAGQGNGWQTADHGKKQNRTQPKSDGVILAYVKNVSDKVDARLLRNTLEEFGELKYFDVSRPKNCAFVEFATPEGYAAAAAASPHTINGESIVVEERRPRPGQFGAPGTPAYGRGGTPAGRGRGGFQGQGRPGSQSGGSFPKDAGRGSFQGRGGSKGGNVTPKSRGLAQAA